ncbi:TetR/AcrR family transcriptional regulator [Nonomuraea monospora]|uniref:TetR/AcrR family transcriptional regulator n=1 Tax=Nonomuraea monospora TaxID=568818 RepID=A0ABN3D0Q5_9ACTN
MAHQPTTDRGRRSRDRIVAAASELMATHGVSGTGIERVLARAGASKSQLYHFFDDKDDLVRAVIQARLDGVLGAQGPLLAELDDWAGIRRWLDLMISENEANGLPGCPIGSLAAELCGRDEAARADLERCFEILEGHLADGLASMRARGLLVAEADPRRLAMVVFAAFQGGLLLARTRQDVEPLRVALDAAYEHLRSFRSD